MQTEHTIEKATETTLISFFEFVQNSQVGLWSRLNIHTRNENLELRVGNIQLTGTHVRQLTDANSNPLCGDNTANPPKFGYHVIVWYMSLFCASLVPSIYL